MNFDSIGENVFRVFRMTTSVVGETPESAITKLYIEFTIALFLALASVLFLYKVTPYFAGAIIFFIKFCLCVVVFSMSVHMFKHSKIVNFILTGMNFVFSLFSKSV